jgi:hypothetical protein
MSMILERVVPTRRIPRPPGPSGASLLRAFTSRQPEASGDWFVRTAREHPRLCYLYGGPRRHTYVVNHPDLVSEVLRTKGRVMRKGPPFQVMKALFGEGMITSDEPLHRRQRALAQPAFHAQHIARYAAQMVTTAVEHERTWHAGRELDMTHDMLGLTLAVVGRTLFGADLRGDVGEMGRSLGVALEGFRALGYIPLGRALLRTPLPVSRRTRAASERVDRVVRRVIAERRGRPGAAEPDLLDLLMLPDAAGERMSDEHPASANRSRVAPRTGSAPVKTTDSRPRSRASRSCAVVRRTLRSKPKSGPPVTVASCWTTARHHRIGLRSIAPGGISTQCPTEKTDRSSPPNRPMSWCSGSQLTVTTPRRRSYRSSIRSRWPAPTGG